MKNFRISLGLQALCLLLAFPSCNLKQRLQSSIRGKSYSEADLKVANKTDAVSTTLHHNSATDSSTASYTLRIIPEGEMSFSPLLGFKGKAS